MATSKFVLDKTVRQEFIINVIDAMMVEQNPPTTYGEIVAYAKKIAYEGEYRSEQRPYFDGLSVRGMDKLVREIAVKHAELNREKRVAALESKMREEAIEQMVAGQAELDGNEECYQREEERAAASYIAAQMSTAKIAEIDEHLAAIDKRYDVYDAEVDAWEAGTLEPIEPTEEPNERRSPTIRQRTITRLASEM